MFPLLRCLFKQNSAILLMDNHHLIYNSFLECYVEKNSDLKFLPSSVIAISHMELFEYKVIKIN